MHDLPRHRLVAAVLRHFFFKQMVFRVFHTFSQSLIALGASLYILNLQVDRVRHLKGLCGLQAASRLLPLFAFKRACAAGAHAVLPQTI